MKGLYGTAKAGKYTLVYDAYSLALLEKDFEAKNINEVFAILQQMQEGMSMDKMLTVLKAGLVDEHPDADQKLASKMIAEVGLEEVSEALSTALSSAFPDSDDDAGEVGNVKSKPRGRGKRS